MNGNHVTGLGDVVVNATPTSKPEKKQLVGRFFTLDPLDADRDCVDLYQACHGDQEREAIWKYIPFGGPFTNVDGMCGWLKSCETHAERVFFAVRDNASGVAIGMVSFLNIVPVMRSLELGFIWYHPKYQRTKTNTESIYLMLCEAFDRLHYRRAEWKCDSLNRKSRDAALRLGMRYEGIFRQHMINRGRNRDTAWYSMMDHEWPRIKANMEKYLYGDSAVSISLAKLNGITEPETNKQLVKRFYSECMSTGDTSRLSEYVAEDYLDMYFNNKRGIEAMRHHINAVRKTYPDLVVDITQQYADGDFVISTFVATATHKGEWFGITPTGKRVEIAGVNIDKIEGGKIVEHRGHADTFEALLGIGAIKPS